MLVGEKTTLSHSFQRELVLETGDGKKVPISSEKMSITYDEAGWYELKVLDKQDGQTLGRFDMAVAKQRFTAGASKVVEPKGADILTQILPKLIVGKIDNRTLAVGFSLTDGPDTDSPFIYRVGIAETNSEFITTEEKTIRFPLAVEGSDTDLGSIQVKKAKLRLQVTEGFLYADGFIALDDILDMVVDLTNGALTRKNAKELVISVLELDPNNLPLDVAIKIKSPMVERLENTK